MHIYWETSSNKIMHLKYKLLKLDHVYQPIMKISIIVMRLLVNQS